MIPQECIDTARAFAAAALNGAALADSPIPETIEARRRLEALLNQPELVALTMEMLAGYVAIGLSVDRHGRSAHEVWQSILQRDKELRGEP